jgi:multisubunit Na+/H+ antiporter MnhC subunit
MQRSAMGMLFALLATALTAVAIYALTGGDSARRLVVGVAAAAVAVWLATVSAGAFRRGGR